jgi:hypothetical protein
VQLTNPPIDYGEVVDVIAQPPDVGGEYDRGGRIARLPLDQAIRLVIEDLASTRIRQLSAVILRDEGPHLMDLASIRAIYDRDDFPPKKET